MKKYKPMIFILGGLILIGLGTWSFWHGGQLINKEETNKLNYEINRLKQMGDVQLQTSKYLEELNENAKSVFVRIKLKDKFSFQSLCPLNFGFGFSYSDKSQLSFTKLVTDNHVTDSDGKVKESFKIYSILVEDSIHIIDEFIEIRKREAVDELLIQVFITQKMKGTIREFHDQHFMVFLSDQLLEKVSSIELIVNGWKLYQEDFNNLDWIEVEFPWLFLKQKNIKMYQSRLKGYNERPTSVPIINVYSNLPYYEENISKTQFYGTLIPSTIYR